jgi:hypothetical protein
MLSYGKGFAFNKGIEKKTELLETYGKKCWK